MSSIEQCRVLGIDLIDKHSDFRALPSCLKTSMGTSTCWTSPKTSTSQWANRRVTTTKRKFKDMKNISNATVDLTGEVTVSTLPFIDFLLTKKTIWLQIVVLKLLKCLKITSPYGMELLIQLVSEKKSNWKSWCSDFTWSMTNRQQP